MTRLLCILLICLLSPLLIYAQENTGYLNGVILDSLSSQKLIGVTVYVPEDTIQIGTVSDVNGFYSLELPAGEHQIKVSYIGYEDKIINVEIDTEETLTKNVLIHPPILRKPEAGEEIDKLYGHWRITCIKRDGKTQRPSKSDKRNSLSGLYYYPFQDHEDGIGIFRYSLGGDKIGDFYFRHSGHGEIIMDHVFLSEITGVYRPRSKVYNNLNFGKIWDAYSVRFKSDKKMIIENDKIRMICKRVI